MKITIESTEQTTHINGVPARIWAGKTDSGIPVHCFITRIAAPDTDDLSQFERELKEHKPPEPELMLSIPLRMIL